MPSDPSESSELEAPQRDEAPSPYGYRPDASGARGAADAPPFGSRMMPNDYPPGYAPAGTPSRHTPLWVKLIGGCLIVGVALLVVLACAAGTTAWAFIRSTPATASSTQSFPVSGVPSVRIQSTAGDIDVVPGAAGTVTVRVSKYARALTNSSAQDELRQLTVAITQTGNTLDVRVNEPVFHFQLWDDRHVDLRITVPAQANVAATLDAGNVDLTGVSGTIGLQDNAGDISLREVTLAGSSYATNNAGNIDVTGALAPGASFAARDNAGNVTATMPRETSARLTASTNAGDLNVDAGWPITISRGAAGGSASGDLTPNPTGTLILETNAGNVSLHAAS
jgi:hypothetical protein